MSWEWGWPAYVSVAEKKQEAQRRLAKLRKKGQPVAPISITGRKIAHSFWGISWCENLERYSDYETRLPRGRSYVRNDCVIDLQVAKGQVTAKVSGSDLYSLKIKIEPVTPPRWKAICKDCTGAIDSLVELLQGRLAKGVMDRVCRQADGLFPTPGEIKFSCSCPDWADMCKHVAAALYGIGARLDEKPELLFLLRGVDEGDLIADAGAALAEPKSPLGTPDMLVGGDMAALFGLDMADSAAPKTPAVTKKRAPPRKAAKSAAKPTAVAKRPRKTGAVKTAKASAPAKTPKTRAAEKPPRAPTKKAVAKKAAAKSARSTSKSLATPAKPRKAA